MFGILKSVRKEIHCTEYLFSMEDLSLVRLNVNSMHLPKLLQRVFILRKCPLESFDYSIAVTRFHSINQVNCRPQTNLFLLLTQWGIGVRSRCLLDVQIRNWIYQLIILCACFFYLSLSLSHSEVCMWDTWHSSC